jgi:hypothetical protein
MEQVQPIKAIDDFLSQKTSIPKHMIHDESFLQTINNNILWLSQIQLSPQSYFLKLNQISSILKKHNLEHIHINFNFKSTHLGVLEEQASFDFYCESFYKENPQYKKSIEETAKKYLEEQQKILQNNENNLSEDENFPLVADRFSSIFHQKEKLKDLFIQFFEIVQDFKDAINLTSISIFELEMLSLQEQMYALYYNELYSKDNPLDKWFAAIHIQNFYKKPQFFVKTNKKQ